MTKYEILSLILTGTYDLLTLLILIFIIYEAIIKPRLPDIAFYPQKLPQDTKSWTWITPYMDFVIENRGCDLQNLKISSIPDYIGWGKIRSTPNIIPKTTSQYFKKIPYLSKNEKYQILWCDMHENKDVLDKPFKVIIAFDNPAFFIPKRVKKSFEFD
ncbi:MAG: hypothetical protein FJ126_03285, partial [Deltaproteobacteria bacterium]|nr:hypothetical protein [Deltaproteobacteria bacterium]